MQPQRFPKWCGVCTKEILFCNWARHLKTDKHLRAIKFADHRSDRIKPSAPLFDNDDVTVIEAQSVFALNEEIQALQADVRPNEAVREASIVTYQMSLEPDLLTAANTWLNSGPNDRPDIKMLYKYCSVLANESRALMIQACKPAKLTSLLKQAVPIESLNNQQLLGLTVALLATDETQSLQSFLKAMEQSRRDSVLNSLPQHLNAMFPRHEVCQWLAGNWKFITRSILMLAMKLSSRKQEDDKQIENILHMARVVALHHYSLEEFIESAIFMLDNEGTTICDHLKINPEQPLMLMDDFQALVMKITHLSRPLMIRFRPLIFILPVCSWLKRLCELLEVEETTLCTNEPVSHWVHDLSFRFCQVDLRQMQSFIDGSAPNYLSLFEIAKIKPTPLQQAIAIYALASLNQKTKQIWVVPTGTGKSFVIATISMIAAMQTLTRSIYIVIPNEKLRARDSNFFTPLWRTTGKHTVRYHSSLGFIPDENDLVVIDESDKLMHDNPGQFFSFLNHKNVICFNGAVGEAQSQEDYVLKHYRIHRFDYWPKSLQHLVPTPFVNLELEDEGRLFQMLRSEIHSHPILLYCELNMVAKLVHEKIEYVLVEQMQLEELRNLDIKLQSGCYPLLVTSEPDIMRGYDFRSQKVGMVLMIAKSFATMRDAKQGMGRVGRFGETARRYQLKSVPLVDELANQLVFAKMAQHIKMLQVQQNKMLQLGPKQVVKKEKHQVDYSKQHILPFHKANK